MIREVVVRENRTVFVSACFSSCCCAGYFVLLLKRPGVFEPMTTRWLVEMYSYRTVAGLATLLCGRLL